MTIAFVITDFWWFLTTLPLLIAYQQRYYVEKTEKMVSSSLKRLIKTIKGVCRNKKVFTFLLAYFFYIDGVFTVIDMATAYGQALGLDSNGLLLALLVTQIVAFQSVLILNELAKKIPSATIITICIIAYLGISLYAYMMKTQLDFWILAIAIGMFQGSTQALLRSYFGKIRRAFRPLRYFRQRRLNSRHDYRFSRQPIDRKSQPKRQCPFNHVFNRLIPVQKSSHTQPKKFRVRSNNKRLKYKKALAKTARAFYQCLISHFPRQKRTP